MKKVCFVTSIVTTGSVGTYTKELLKRLIDKYEMHLITGDNISLDKVFIHKRPNIRSRKLGWVINNSLNTLYSVAIKRRYNIDIIHTQYLTSLYADIVTMHGCVRSSSEYESSFYESRIKLNIQKIVERKLIENTKKIISVSEGLKQELLKYYKVSNEKIAVIPNGVNINKFKPNLKKRITIRKILKVSDEDILLIFSGSDYKRKGLTEIIKALPNIYKNTKLVVTSSSDSTHYEQLASKLGVSDRVIFTGFVPKVEDYYCAADIFVFPSLYEAFSLATLEAAACGLPLITTKINGTEELVKEGYNGFFVERDPKDIAEKVNILVKDEKLRKQMGKNARKLVEKKYTWEICAKKTAEVYEEVLRR